MDGAASLGRFDSAQLFSIFKADGDNLIDFDGLAGVLDFEDGTPLQLPLLDDDEVLLPQVLAADTPLLPGTSPQSFTDIKSEQDETSHSLGPNSWAFNGSNSAAAGSDGHGESSHDQLLLQHPSTSPPALPPQPPLAAQRARSSSGGGDATTSGAGGGSEGGRRTSVTENGIKKRRTRNDEQMEMNRIAQQKYRERKKNEQQGLAQAVEMLTAQVAALKAIEVKAKDLEVSNQQLASTVAQQAGTIQALQAQVAGGQAELAAKRSEVTAAQALVASQQAMILQQHQKLHLQEQIIASLKDRLKEKIDEAMQHVVPGSVCEKMVAAVKATLYGAKDQHQLQDVLAQLPEELVVELCKNIFQVCKESWPELKLKCSQLGACPGVVANKCGS